MDFFVKFPELGTAAQGRWDRYRQQKPPGRTRGSAPRWFEKVPVTVDRWQFNDASLTIAGTDIDIMPASYPANGTGPEGLTAEIVDCGTGFAEDYEGKDVEGKIVLVAMDWEEGWIDNFTNEAWLHGAAALVTYSLTDYAQYSDDMMTIQT